MASKVESNGPMCELHSCHRAEMETPRHPKSTHRFTKVSSAWKIRRRERERGKVSQLLGGRFSGAFFSACLLG